MPRFLYILFIIVTSFSSAIAQSYYHVTHTSGKATIGNIEVEVKGLYSPSTDNYCGAGPYRIGQNASSSANTYSGYQFTFSKAIHIARFQITASEKSEKMTFYVNGMLYPLTVANLSAYTGSCGNNGNSIVSPTGDLIFSAGGNNNTEVKIIDSIVSIAIINIDSSAGSVFSFDFVTDTVVNVVDCNDTVLCVGDTIQVGYDISGTFAPSNIFTLQLSDKHGSFSTPTTLGTKNSSSSGHFKVKIPKVASADKYMVRITSTNPVYTSKPSEFSLEIGNPPVAEAFNNGPVCDGEMAMLWATIYANSNYTNVWWTGPAFAGKMPTRVYKFDAVKLSDSGIYIGRIEDYGCTTYDTTYLEVHPNPVNALASTSANICNGDTLLLNSSIDTSNALNVWLAPDGHRDTTAHLIVTPVDFADSGIYILTTYQYGCSSRDTAAVTVRKTPVPSLSVNTPCVGDALVLTAGDTTTGAMYNWKGPSGFIATKADTTIPSALFDAAGTYVLTVTANGCTATDSIVAAIKQKPYQPRAAADTLLCEGQSLHLNGLDTMSNTNTAYSWVGPNGYASNTGSNIINDVPIAASGQYVFSGNLDGCIAADTILVLVKHTPLPPDISSNSPLQTGQTLHLALEKQEPNVNYVWTGPNGFSSNVFSPSIEKVSRQQMGTYIMTAALEGCSSSAITLVTIEDAVDTGYLLLYPNPNNGNFTIKGLFKTEQQIPIRITNSIGQLVHSETVATQQKLISKTFDFKGRFASGVYTIRLLIDGKLHSIPFTIVRD